jgi:Leucine-rich repeat (LRR) protein
VTDKAGSNQLVRLPAAIGELHNLKELNIGNNKIVSIALDVTLPGIFTD